MPAPTPSTVHQEPRYSVVVPVYNSDRSVIELVDRLRNVFEETLGVPYEILLIDDGSENPTTWPTLAQLAGEYPPVIAIQLMRNFGKTGAVLCGLQHIRGLWAVTIDDDLQQWPEDIPALICYEDHDVVIAQFAARNDGRFKRLTSWVKGRLDRYILGLPCTMSPFKLFNAQVAQGMVKSRTSHPFIPALMGHVTRDFVSVPARHSPSRHGKSRYTFVRRFKKFLNLLIGNSSLLLRGIGLIGVLASFSGFVFALYVIARKILGTTIAPGWASLMVINLVFGGLILIALSVIGEYLIRILDDSANKPSFIVRRIIGTDVAEQTSYDTAKQPSRIEPIRVG